MLGDSESTSPPVPRWPAEPGDLGPEQTSADPEALVATARTIIRELHRTFAGAEIRMADAAGRFPGAPLVTPPPIVTDANVLLNDVLYACKHDGQPTTLVNAANTGLIRLYVAQHVLEEIAKHYSRVCSERSVDPATFISLWARQYAPLLRVVPTIPTALLSPDEEARVEKLRKVDPDDIPSVTLALLLRGFYLSEDQRANEAVYGQRRSAMELQQWRQVLQAGGDAGLLGAAFEVTIITTALVGRGIWGIFDRVTVSLPTWLRVLLPVAVTVGGGYLARRLPDEPRERAKEKLGHVGQVLSVLGGEYAIALERLREAEPDVPSWDKLADTVGPEATLVRACLVTLARSRGSDRSAGDLAEALPPLPVAQGDAEVRAVLRGCRCFEEVYQGRWQVGRAIIRDAGDDDQ